MITDLVLNYFQDFFNSVPDEYQVFISLLFYTILITIYSIFIWKFYKFLASREILKLNLSQYNYSKYPGLEKFFAIILYTLEYMIILPFLVLFWFTILSLFLLLLSKSESVHQILLISAAIIASTRIAAYTSEELSKDLAKIFPFTVLALFLLGENFFNIPDLLSRFSQIPNLLNNILIFIIFIFSIEFVLRGLYSLFQVFQSRDEQNF